MTLRQPAGILVDLDGTLLDSQAGASAAVEATAHAAFALLGVPTEQWVAANNEAFSTTWMRESRAWELGTITSAELSHATYAATLTLLGEDPNMADRFSRLHGEVVRDAARMYDDAGRFVAGVTAAQIPMALVTNGGDSQRALIAAVGLEKAFAHTFISSEHGVAKPDPAVFRAACSALGADPLECWHVGDSLEADVAGASAVGLHTVWVNRTHRPLRGSIAPSLSVSGLDELSRILG